MCLSPNWGWQCAQGYYDSKSARIGEVTNVGTPSSDVDYVTELARVAASQSATTSNPAQTNKRLMPTLWGNFDQSYQPINSGYPSAAASTYGVLSGDTLISIARSVWGDGDLWWVIAQANGFVGNGGLTSGMNLVIPNKVTNVRNNAGPFKCSAPFSAPSRSVQYLFLANH